MKRPRYARPRKARAHDDPVPLYHQAYPTFSITGVAQRFNKGERFCEWFDQHQLVGQMDVVDLADNALEILYSCGTDTYRHQRTALFTVMAQKQASGRRELRVACEQCRRLRLHMLFKGGTWRCRQCHHLVDRGAFLGGTNRLIARREKLIKLLHPLNRELDSQSLYVRYKTELHEINEYLDEVGARYLPPVLRHVAMPVWFAHDDDRTERELSDETPPHINKPYNPPPKIRRMQMLLGGGDDAE